MIRLCGLRVNRNAQTGKVESLTGTAGPLRFMAFPVLGKKAPEHPDFDLFICEYDKHGEIAAPAKLQETAEAEEEVPFEDAPCTS
jgi:hypothetical protein